MVKPKYQVFISSTYEDMKEERLTAMNAILSKKHIPAGMEYFSARFLDQFQVIMEWIEMSDIFLLLLGGRYGSICKETKKSYVDMELEYAQKLNKPIIAIIIDDNYLADKKAHAYQERNMIYSDDRTDLYNNLVSKIKKMRKIYSNLDNLSLEIIKALDEIENDPNCKLNGWIPRYNEKLYQYPDRIAVDDSILQHFLERFLLSLQFQYANEEIKTGRGYFISDIRELATGEWDYSYSEKATINYMKLKPIDNTTEIHRILDYQQTNSTKPDILSELIKFHFNQSEETFVIQALHNVDGTEHTNSIYENSNEHSSGVSKYTAKLNQLKITYRDFTITIPFSSDLLVEDSQNYSDREKYYNLI